MFFTLASALEGGGRLVSTAAAKRAPTTRTISPETNRRRSSAALDSPASRRGFVRARLTEASTSAAVSRPIFQSSALPYEVSQSERERRQLQQRLADPGADQREHRDERDVREARDDDAERGHAPLAGHGEPEDDESDQPAEPDRPRGEVQGVERHGDSSRRLLAGVARQPGQHERRRRRGERGAEREQLGHRALRAVRPVDQERDRRQRPRTGRARARGRGSPSRSSTRGRPGRSRRGRRRSEARTARSRSGRRSASRRARRPAPPRTPRRARSARHRAPGA